MPSTKCSADGDVQEAAAQARSPRRRSASNGDCSSHKVRRRSGVQSRRRPGRPAPAPGPRSARRPARRATAAAMQARPAGSGRRGHRAAPGRSPTARPSAAHDRHSGSPGMKLSGTSLRNLIHAVVVAKDPMPSVSKKLVTAPKPIDSRVGRSSPRCQAALQQYTGKGDREQAQCRQQDGDDHAVGNSRMARTLTYLSGMRLRQPGPSRHTDGTPKGKSVKLSIRTRTGVVAHCPVPCGQPVGGR